jgi:hypothetical protein
MRTITSLDGRTIALRTSLGKKIPYVENWEDNVLRTPGQTPWPASLLKQVRGYPAQKRWFAPEDAEALAVRLGRISKFQSLNSEDAVTWSWFGTLGCASPSTRSAVVQWLYDCLDLNLTASPDVGVDQWMRVWHPNAPNGRRGPELDARVDDPGGALIYVEAKWNAKLGFGKGATEKSRDDQVVLRRDSFRADPKLRAHRRPFVVLGISNQRPDLAVYGESSDVTVGWLTWADMAQCDAHPLAREFREYLDWKRAAAALS